MVQILLFWRNMGLVLIHTVGTVPYGTGTGTLVL
jgi:hypothetical protein